MDKLQAYRDKRDAARTPEPVPPPGVPPPDEPPGGTFVIQEHHARRLHWDFRLERGGVLVSWALPKGVPSDPAVNHLAVHTEDHPLEYGRFEGQIPRGEYGAGAVTIWDHGTYETVKWAPSEVKVLLHGQRVTGGYVLFQTKGNQWMIHRERLALPGPLRPMLAVTAPAPRDLDHWALEMKWDGVRALAYIERGQVRLMSRTERDITVTYPELSRLGAATTHKQLLLDGEIVVFGADGWPEFEALQPRMHVSSAAQAALLAGQTPVTYLVFDLLQLDGRPLMDLGYAERRALLDEMALAGPNWQAPPWFPGGDFEAVQAVSDAHHMEGVVAKRLDSRYRPGERSPHWQKIKPVQVVHCAILGYEPDGERDFKSLIIGTDVDGELRCVGKVGSGLTVADKKRLFALLTARRRAQPLVPTELRGCWVEPGLYCSVSYLERTASGSLRAPVFLALLDN